MQGAKIGGGDPVKERLKCKAKTPCKLTMKGKKAVKVEATSGQWMVTPHGLHNILPGSASYLWDIPHEDNHLNTVFSTCNLNDIVDTTSVPSEDREILDLNAQEAGEFEETLVQVVTLETLKLQQEVFELEKKVQEKQLCTLNRKNAKLLWALEQDEEENSKVTFKKPPKKKSTASKGKAKRVSDE